MRKNVIFGVILVLCLVGVCTVSAETQITTDRLHQGHPAVYDDKIVWQDYRNGNWDIYMYNLSTNTLKQITTNESDQYNPDIYDDKIVWDDYRNGNYDIYMYDLSTDTETQITTNTDWQTRPDIYDDKIVWQDNMSGGVNYGIYMYNLSTDTETQITTDESDQRHPAIYDDKIVCEDNWNIYMYDLSTDTETQITIDGVDNYYPAIYDDKIVWEDNRNGNQDIYMYDLSTDTETQITTDESDQSRPDIYDDKIVWDDNRDGNYNIYMYNKNVAPTVDAGPDQTVNEGETVSFSGSFTDPGDDTHTIEWDFGDGSEVETGTLNPEHTYADNGTYTVTLTVTDDDGGVGTDSLNVTVSNVAPVASIDSIDQPNPDFILPDHVLTFNGSFTDPGWLDTHTSSWDFDDGTTLTGSLDEENDPPDSTGNVTAEHSYSEPGTYTVTLTVTDDDGGVATDTSTLTVLSAEEATQVIDDKIQNLTDETFKNNAEKRKNALSEKLEEVKELIEAEEYQEAINKLQNDIRAKADGSVDGNPRNDWITDPDAQEEICDLIDDLVDYLETLL